MNDLAVRALVHRRDDHPRDDVVDVDEVGEAVAAVDEDHAAGLQQLQRLDRERRAERPIDDGRLDDRNRQARGE